MCRWIARIGLVAAVMTGATGCVTIKLVEIATNGQTRDNIALSANAAWLEEDAGLSLCLDGWPAERRRSGEPGRFGFTLPAHHFILPADYAVSELRDVENIPIFEVAPDIIAPGCPAKTEGTTEITVEHFMSGHVTAESGMGQDWRTKIDPSHKGPRLYSIEEHGPEGTALLVYQFGGAGDTHSRFVRLDLPPEKLPPNPFLLLGLPLSVAFDAVILLPLILVAVLSRGGGGDFNIGIDGWPP